MNNRFIRKDSICYADSLDPFYVLDGCSDNPVSRFANSPILQIPYHHLPLYVWFKNPFLGRWLPCVKCADDGRLYVSDLAQWIAKAKTMGLDLHHELPLVRKIVEQAAEGHVSQLADTDRSDIAEYKRFFENWHITSLALLDELQSM
ncbi:hypothetical protein AURDEDRAFT_176432 [Auricularia subglabra TFB-10046 SS5]|uniref:Uncharacterized protein n=1 Tax=Auricularia subglabra (strain TFB-10046 / SS5) TaxID=717982 RepID=J0LD87_AURST|nr:hypothetical protein AURDEDRAFT_176432 [Auricularia subglabra TFB-10046 SS5]